MQRDRLILELDAGHSRLATGRVTRRAFVSTAASFATGAVASLAVLSSASCSGAGDETARARKLAERMLEIQSWLGLPLHANLLDPMKKIVPDDLRDAIHNYDEFSTNVRAMLMDYPMGKDTPMGWCLDRAVVPAG